MKYKKEVAQAMAAMLKNELRKLDGNIRSNVWKINRIISEKGRPMSYLEMETAIKKSWELKEGK